MPSVSKSHSKLFTPTIFAQSEYLNANGYFWFITNDNSLDLHEWEISVFNVKD